MLHDSDPIDVYYCGDFWLRNSYRAKDSTGTDLAH